MTPVKSEFEVFLKNIEESLQIELVKDKPANIVKKIIGFLNENDVLLEIEERTIYRFIEKVKSNNFPNSINDTITNHIFCSIILLKNKKINEIELDDKTKSIKKIYIYKFVSLFGNKVDIKEIDINIPNRFIKTNWFIFAKTSKGIALRTLKISDRIVDGEVYCEYILEDDSVDDYEGIVKQDKSQCYLIFNLKTKEEGLKSLHIKLKKGNGTKPTLMLGQMSFIDHDQDLWTLNIVALKSDGISINLGVYKNDTIDIPEEIKEYFNKAERTSLTLPKEIIIELNGLKKYNEKT